jgi:hypothetical protein
MKLFTRIAVGMLLVSAAAGAAQARTVNGASGRAVLGSDLSCFNSWNTAAVNVCSTAKWFDVPLMVDNPGSRQVQINGAGTNQGDVKCNIAVVDQHITMIWGTTQVSIGGLSSGGFWIAGVVPSVPAGGMMWASCLVAPGGRVDSFTYTP